MKGGQLKELLFYMKIFFFFKFHCHDSKVPSQTCKNAKNSLKSIKVSNDITNPVYACAIPPKAVFIKAVTKMWNGSQKPIFHGQTLH